MFCGEVWLGILWWRKRYYKYYFASANHYELILADWFDTIPKDVQELNIKWLGKAAFMRYAVLQDKTDRG